MIYAITIDPTFGVIIGAVVTAIVGLILQNRRLSGDIQSSEAKDLWTASESMQERLTARMELLEKRVGDLEELNFKLRGELLVKTTRIIELERELGQKQERCEALQRENEHLKSLLKRNLGGLD